MTWLEAATERFEAVGIGVRGIAAAEGLDAVLPGARSVVVFASGGRRLWGHLDAAVPDPVDAVVHGVLDTLEPDASRRWVPCTDAADVHLDFQGLAIRAGLGQRGRIGLVLHPTYGPWLGLRAACLTTEALDPSPAAPSPCAGCSAPCVAACPARAVDRTADWARCGAWQATATTCVDGCLARIACPVGAEHAYSGEQHRYHHHPPSRATVLDALRKRP